jgi:hypothetical protein
MFAQVEDMALMSQDFHDGLGAGAFSASCVPRVAEPVGVDGGLVLADLGEGLAKPVTGVGQNAVPQEQVAHRVSQVGVEDSLVWLGWRSLARARSTSSRTVRGDRGGEGELPGGLQVPAP